MVIIVPYSFWMSQQDIMHYNAITNKGVVLMRCAKVSERCVVDSRCNKKGDMIE